MAGLPLAKIFAVFLKEAAKPVAGQLKRYAVDHPVARRMTMSIGRAYENTTQRIEIAFRGHHVKSLKPVPDAHALTVGADVVSQSFLLSVAIGIVVFEYWRSDKQKRIENATKKKEKQERQAAKEARMKLLEDRIAYLEKRLRESEHGPIDRLLEAASGALPVALTGTKAHSTVETPAETAQAGKQAAQDAKSSAASTATTTQRAQPAARPRSETEEACETLHLPKDSFSSFLAPEAAAEAATAAKRAAHAKKEEVAQGLFSVDDDEYHAKGWGYAGGSDPSRPQDLSAATKKKKADASASAPLR